MQHYNCSEAMVVTSNYFTRGAQTLVRSTVCTLVDRDLLTQWVCEYSGQIEPPATASELGASTAAQSLEVQCSQIAMPGYPSDSRIERFTDDEQLGVAQEMTTAASDPEAKAIVARETAQNLEAKCREIAKREYPTDSQMQRFTYDEQRAAARYMSSTASDPEAKAIAVREYAEDFEMQKFKYDEQLAAKAYMQSVPAGAAKQQAIREYPNDFSMQKFTYDQLAQDR